MKEITVSNWNNLQNKTDQYHKSLVGIYLNRIMSVHSVAWYVIGKRLESER